MKKEEGKMVALILKGMVAEATPEEQAQVNAAIRSIKASVEAHGDPGKVALAIVMADVTAEGGYEQ